MLFGPERAEEARLAAFDGHSGGFPRSASTCCLWPQQPPDRVPVCQRRGGEQPSTPLGQAPVARLGDIPERLRDVNGVHPASPGGRAQTVKPTLVVGQGGRPAFRLSPERASIVGRHLPNARKRNRASIMWRQPRGSQSP